MEHQSTPKEAAVRRLREASRRFGERSTALTDTDIDVAALARNAYRKAQFEQEADEGRTVADDQVSSRQALGVAVAQIESEVRSDFRTGVRSDLLLGVGPAVLLTGVLGIVAVAFDAVISLPLVFGSAFVLVVLAGIAAAASSDLLGTRFSRPARELGGPRLLETSAGALMCGLLLAVVSGVVLSQHTTGRQMAARTEVARELDLMDSSVQLTLAAEQIGIEPKRALQLASRATGVDWRVESPKPDGKGYFHATMNLPKAVGIINYASAHITTSFEGLPRTQLVSDKGWVLGERTHLVATIGNQSPLPSGRVKLSLLGSPESVKSYALAPGVAVPPAGTKVVASVAGDEEVVLLQPVEWLAAQVMVANAEAPISPSFPQR